MTARRPGFPAEGLAFLRALARNNDRDWFAARKAEYEAVVRAPMVAVVEALNEELAAFAPSCVADPGRAIPRPHRDVRFSADKSPYKTSVSAVFPCRGLPKQSATGYFVGVSAEGAELVAGAHVPDTDALAALRRDAAARPAAWARVLAQRALRTHWGEPSGERLQRVPKGFDAQGEAADLLRLRQWSLRCELAASVVTSDRFVASVAERFRSAAPWVLLQEEVLAPRAAR